MSEEKMSGESGDHHTCRLCGCPCVHFSKSHIIPWGFFKHGQWANEMSLITEGGISKRLNKGVYDDHFLCDECEHRHFYAPDAYAIRIFRDLSGGVLRTVKTSIGQSCQYYVFDNVDRKLMRAFFASVLWRCSASSRNEFKDINIGPTYEKRIADDLLHDGDFAYVDAIGVRLDSSSQSELIQGINMGCMLPQKTKLHHSGRMANGYNLFLPGYKFCVTLDQRKHPFAYWSDEQLRNDARFANVSPSLSSKYDGFGLMLFESDYPMSMVQQIHTACKSTINCIGRPLKKG